MAGIGENLFAHVMELMQAHNLTDHPAEHLAVHVLAEAVQAGTARKHLDDFIHAVADDGLDLQEVMRESLRCTDLTYVHPPWLEVLPIPAITVEHTCIAILAGNQYHMMVALSTCPPDTFKKATSEHLREAITNYTTCAPNRSHDQFLTTVYAPLSGKWDVSIVTDRWTAADALRVYANATDLGMIDPPRTMVGDMLRLLLCHQDTQRDWTRPSVFVDVALRHRLLPLVSHLYPFATHTTAVRRMVAPLLFTGTLECDVCLTAVITADVYVCRSESDDRHGVCGACVTRMQKLVGTHPYCPRCRSRLLLGFINDAPRVDA